MQRFPADAETVQHAGSEALDHDVVARGKAEEQLAPLGALEIEAQRALVPVERVEPAGEPLFERREDAEVIADMRILELIDRGA
jgi:hypothetical protein